MFGLQITDNPWLSTRQIGQREIRSRSAGASDCQRTQKRSRCLSQDCHDRAKFKQFKIRKAPVGAFLLGLRFGVTQRYTEQTEIHRVEWNYDPRHSRTVWSVAE